MNQALIDKLEAGIPSIMRDASVPGLAITLVHGDAIRWSQVFGFRDAGKQAPLTLDTVFEAASFSKPVFAYAVLTLCEKGLLDLDVELTNYMPQGRMSIVAPIGGLAAKQVKVEKQSLQGITLRHVLYHSTGFPNWPSEQRPMKQHFVPGERFSYTGVSYSIAQSIMEVVTGQPAEATIQANIFEPFDMHHSSFVWNGDESLPIAVGHDENGQATKKAMRPEMIAGASLHSTPIDFANFMLAIMQPSVDNPYHLSAYMIDDMLTSQIQVNDSASWHDDWPRQAIKVNESVGWGLGWGIQNDGSFWHWGDNVGYQNFVIGSLKEKSGVVIMTNGKNGKRVYEQIMRTIVGGNYPSLDWLMSLY